jgi:hypothetical protein
MALARMPQVPLIGDRIAGADVSKNLVVADIVTKVLYFSLATATFVFVSMLLLTALHP